MNPQARQMRFSLAITGASGVCYGVRLLEVLGNLGHRMDLILSEPAQKCLELETDLPSKPEALLETLKVPRDLVEIHSVKDIASSLASGSSLFDLHAGFIVPCSMGTVARIAMGNSGNLIERHADVLIKERKSLVIVPRETPLSEIHLENLLRLRRLGCHVVAAMPGFYHRPQTLNDVIDHVVGKALDAVGVSHQLYQRWRRNDHP